MPFAFLAAFIFVLALSGKKATKETYWLIALAALGAALWIYVG
jgi:hypothetical protein